MPNPTESAEPTHSALPTPCTKERGCSCPEAHIAELTPPAEAWADAAVVISEGPLQGLTHIEVQNKRALEEAIAQASLSDERMAEACDRVASRQLSRLVTGYTHRQSQHCWMCAYSVPTVEDIQDLVMVFSAARLWLRDKKAKDATNPAID